jgi:hypothetical protein
MKKIGEEEKVKHILTDPKLSAIKAMLEKDHAIDCLLLLHVKRGKWKEAKDFMRENKLTLSDGTFRARMIEIEQYTWFCSCLCFSCRFVLHIDNIMY